MASDRWKESSDRSGPGVGERSRGEAPQGAGIPDFVRRALSAGLSGFFLTGEAVREALGDSLPKEWADYASEQSARARSEFIDRLSVEVGRAVEGIDWTAVLSKLFEGHTLEVNARVRLVHNEETGRPGLRVSLDAEPADGSDPTPRARRG
jgi:hypothetical protein